LPGSGEEFRAHHIPTANRPASTVLPPTTVTPSAARQARPRSRPDRPFGLIVTAGRTEVRGSQDLRTPVGGAPKFNLANLGYNRQFLVILVLTGIAVASHFGSPLPNRRVI
jgi:hypothetical protein